MAREVLVLAALVGVVLLTARLVGPPPEPKLVRTYDPRDEAPVVEAPPLPPAPVAPPAPRTSRPPPEDAVLLQRLWRRIDEVRAAGASCGGRELPPVGRLRGAPALDDAAWAQATWMVEGDDWAHVTPDNPAGATPDERIAAAGYPGRLAGEVLAWGQRTPREAVAWWLDSPPHCAALMDPDAVHGGAAVVPDPEGGFVWVVVLGE